jgi:hypothetical protein
VNVKEDAMTHIKNTITPVKSSQMILAVASSSGCILFLTKRKYESDYSQFPNYTTVRLSMGKQQATVGNLCHVAWFLILVSMSILTLSPSLENSLNRLNKRESYLLSKVRELIWDNPIICFVGAGMGRTLLLLVLFTFVCATCANNSVFEKQISIAKRKLDADPQWQEMMDIVDAYHEKLDVLLEKLKKNPLGQHVEIEYQVLPRTRSIC